MTLKTLEQVDKAKMSNESLLGELFDWRNRGEYSKEMMDRIVHKLRLRGVAWEHIGTALGCSRQNAMQKYGK